MSLPSSVRSVGLLALLLLGSCATEELTLPDENGGGAPAAGGTSGSASGGKSSSGSPATAGFTTGGAKPSAGSSSGGSATGGTAGGTSMGGGSAGKASGGSAGKPAGGAGTGGSAGAGGSAGTGGSSAGSGPIGTGSCADTPAFVLNAKYAADAKVFATCSGGTPCTSAMPPLMNGKSYEFKCLDQFNCGGQNPGTTNWSQPPWAVTQACE